MRDTRIPFLVRVGLFLFIGCLSNGYTVLPQIAAVGLHGNVTLSDKLNAGTIPAARALFYTVGCGIGAIVCFVVGMRTQLKPTRGAIPMRVLPWDRIVIATVSLITIYVYFHVMLGL